MSFLMNRPHWLEPSFICCICGEREFTPHNTFGNNPAPIRDKFFGRCCKECNKHVWKTRALAMLAANDQNKVEEFLKAFSQHGVTQTCVEREFKRFLPMFHEDHYVRAFWERSDKNDFSKVHGLLEYYCCICGKKNSGYGYDPFPVKLNLYGRCCRECSENIVSKGCCFNCRKKGGGDVTLMFCSRCHSATYCSKKCQKLDWKQCHRSECMTPDDDERKQAATNDNAGDDKRHEQEGTTTTIHQEDTQTTDKDDSADDTMNTSPRKFGGGTKATIDDYDDDDEDNNVEEVYTDFKSHAHSDNAKVADNNDMEEKLLQDKVQNLTHADIKKDAKLSKANKKQILDLLIENQELKITIKQEHGKKLPPPEDLFSCQVCAEEYTYHVDSSEGFNPNLPVQSQACEHVICYGCVCRMQQALLETSNVVKWIKCPMCNTKHAFHAEKPIVSRVTVEWIKSQKKH